jgi:hypothetical protein
MGSVGGFLRVSEPQIHSGRSPNRRRLYRVSEAREDRAAHFEPDEAGLPGVDALRALIRARRRSRVWRVLYSVEPQTWWRMDAT